MSNIKKLLVTGASGHIGRAFARLCPECYSLRLAYNSRPIVSDKHEVVQMDLSDLDSVRQAVRGMDAVVHMGANSSHRAPWDAIRDVNLQGTYNVYEACRLEGVGRVVFGSSNWACAYAIAEQGTVGPEPPNRPSHLYGVSKIFAEVLGSYYHDAYGIASINLRIGYCHDDGDDGPSKDELVWQAQSDPERFHPYQGQVWLQAWISNRDMTQLICKGLETDIEYGVFLATSDNDPGIYDLSETKRALGYEPLWGIQDFYDFEVDQPRDRQVR